MLSSARIHDQARETDISRPRDLSGVQNLFAPPGWMALSGPSGRITSQSQQPLVHLIIEGNRCPVYAASRLARLSGTLDKAAADALVNAACQAANYAEVASQAGKFNKSALPS